MAINNRRIYLKIKQLLNLFLADQAKIDLLLKNFPKFELHKQDHPVNESINYTNKLVQVPKKKVGESCKISTWTVVNWNRKYFYYLSKYSINYHTHHLSTAYDGYNFIPTPTQIGFYPKLSTPTICHVHLILTPYPPHSHSIPTGYIIPPYPHLIPTHPLLVYKL